MKLIIGLGNPGEKYKKTRHNAGFIVANSLWQIANSQWEMENKFSRFKLNKKFNALISDGQYRDEKIIIALPQTFMNESGQAVSAIKKYYRPKADQPGAGKIYPAPKTKSSGGGVKITDIWVIYDDIDLPVGKIRIRKSGSAGGHKGVQSIINILHSKNFSRFRVGIFTENKKIPVEKFVLKKITKKETEIMKETINKTIKAIKMALEKGVDKTMNKFN